MNITVRVEGVEVVLQRISYESLSAPLNGFFQRVGRTFRAGAAQRAPVDTGRLRSSITVEVDSSAPPLWAKVGPTVHYGPYMEYGTGVFAEGPGGGSGRHWPPAGALDLWARRHGFESGHQVARAIGLRGGLLPRRYLRDAFEEGVGRVQGFVDQLGQEIAQLWGG